MKEELKKRIKEVLKSIKNETGEVEEEKLEAAIEKIVDEEKKKVEPKVEVDPNVKEELTTDKITEMVKKEVEEVIDIKLKEAVEKIQGEIEALKAQLEGFGKEAEKGKEVIKEMAKVLKIDPSKALKGQDGDDKDAKKSEELDFGDRDSFGRKKFKEK